LGGTGEDQIYQNSAVNMTGGTFDFAGVSEGFDGLAGTAGVVTNSIAATTSTLTLGQNNSLGTPVFSGVIQDGTGTMALTKMGSGTQILDGASTYTGATTISNGSLQLGNGGHDRHALS
jgi:autotransporter-associated beta strand protein